MPLPRPLSDIEVRVLGSLIEKAWTTPDQYPLTLNSVRLACNQKTNRFPNTAYEEGEVGHALRELESLSLVKATWGARASKFEHRAQSGLGINTKELAVLYPMLIRGPETAAEIRARCQKIHAFDDVDDVEYLLDRLSGDDQALVVELPRQSGQKGTRFMHLLSGEPDPKLLEVAAQPASKSPLAERVDALEAKVEELSRRLAAIEGD